MKRQKICIIGGSLTGLTTAISLAKLNCDIDLVTGNFQSSFDSNRTIAISESNLDFLKKLNIIQSMEKELWPCSIMELYMKEKKEKFSKIFEINTDHRKKKILYMLENSKLLKLMIKKIEKNESISIKSNQKVTEIFTSGLLKGIKFNNKNYKYNLIILCSGSNSCLVKDIFNDHFIQNSYGETSVTTVLNHNSLKNNVAKQFFLEDEILALLPISNTKTSVVWSVKNNKYRKDDLFIKKKLKLYASKYLSNITFASKIEYNDLNFLVRNKYYKDRILLFGDALHSIHPFVGQGYNMILRDLSCLEKILFSKINLGLDIGSSDILSEFTNKTKPNNFAYAMGVDILKNSFSLKNQYVMKIRNRVLKTLDKSNFIKNIFFDIADRGLKF
tara:strand:+ start:1654 stop:2817 length:1164 start_codon:yes stop_codon:yes gene_type:complete